MQLKSALVILPIRKTEVPSRLNPDGGIRCDCWWRIRGEAKLGLGRDGSLDLTPSEVRALIASGTLPANEVAGRYVIDLGEVEQDAPAIFARISDVDDDEDEDEDDEDDYEDE